MIDKFFKKEKPITGMSGFGGGFARFKSAASGVKATGGTAVEPGNGYVYHVFTSSGAIVSDTGGDIPGCDWLVVAGGGSGGPYFGGGGGAGGYRTRSPNAGPLNSPLALTLTTTPTSITVGDGESSTGGARGANSSLGPISCTGGGGGEVGAGGGTTGGSGGGGGPTNGGGTHPGFAGNASPGYSPPQGNPGGTGYHLGDYTSGGGGGAGGAGSNAPNPGPGGPGGNGYPNPDFAAPHVAPALTDAGIPGTEVTLFTNAVGPTGLYAGGGGGISGSADGTGGPGGGGQTGTPNGTIVGGGINYTGGGGSGMRPANGTHIRAGGKGIVIIRYAAG